MLGGRARAVPEVKSIDAWNEIKRALASAIVTLVDSCDAL